MTTLSGTEYRITPRDVDRGTDLDPFWIVAATYEAAATIAARRLHGDHVTALRTTGDRGKSGYFRAYERLSGGALNSVGDPFHVF